MAQDRLHLVKRPVAVGQQARVLAAQVVQGISGSPALAHSRSHTLCTATRGLPVFAFTNTCSNLPCVPTSCSTASALSFSGTDLILVDRQGVTRFVGAEAGAESLDGVT